MMAKWEGARSEGLGLVTFGLVLEAAWEALWGQITWEKAIGAESGFSSGLGYSGLESLELQVSAGAQRDAVPALLPS